jgi:hypothetical protein
MQVIPTEQKQKKVIREQNEIGGKRGKQRKEKKIQPYDIGGCH